MIKFFARISLVFLMIFLVACGQEGGSGRRNKRKGKDSGHAEKVTLPAKGTKIVLFFPAGAGAMGASLEVTKQFEEDLGVNNLADSIQGAGGVSSGSLMAAAMVSGKITSKALQAELANLVRKVFPDSNALVDKLINDYKFALDELEALFTEIMKDPPDMTSPASAEASLEKALINAGVNKISIKSKIGDTKKFVADISANIGAMVNKDVSNAAALSNEIKKILGDVPLSDPSFSKLITYATGDNGPVYFGGTAYASLVNGPFAVGAKLDEALISSSAIPHFIKAPTGIMFSIPGGGTKNIPHLKDGVFATTPMRFDPSRILYDIFTKLFRDEDLLMVYVGNGAPVDKPFRAELRSKYGFKDKISQQTLANGKKITYVAVDTEIVDDNDKNIFNLSQFYGSPQLAQYMSNAGKKAVQSPAYKWAVDAMKAAKQ
jgi:hypothetical protein